MKKTSILLIKLILSALFLTGCQTEVPDPLLSITQTVTGTATSAPSPTATTTPTFTLTPSPTQPVSTETPVPSPTPTWVFNEPGEVVAPILLYHHVADGNEYSRFHVSIADFRAQMQALSDGGYTAIPISWVIEALIDGRALPDKPVVITFDDGHQNVYDNAFPIMQEFGFPGVFYIVANRIHDIPDFVNTDALKEMIDAGWEIGSHTYTHSDVTLGNINVHFEIAQSKTDLEAALSTEVETFAYPYGSITPFIAQRVISYGYQAGVGLGISATHTLNDLFYLHRLEVYGHYNLSQFKEIIMATE